MQKSGVPTLKEIAMVAGVSVPAVSKVLHGRGSSIRVGETKARHIREVAERLQYTPNALARSLRLSRAQAVGLVFEHFGEIAAGPLYYVHLLDGIASELFKYHYRLMILPEIPHHRIAQTLQDGRLDGVIWCKMPEDRVLHKELAERTLPVIALNAAPFEGSPLQFFVSCDNLAGVALAVEHLCELGHRRILFAMEEGELDTPDAQARLRGMRKAAAERDLVFGREDIVRWGRHGEGFDEWIGSNPPHTAIFAWNEGLAGGVLARARARGIHVPSDISVVGFDSTAYCDTTLPRLTAVRQPIKDMARAAAKHLIDLIEGKTPDRPSLMFPCILDVRESTTHPRPALGPLQLTGEIENDS